jgi:long-chain acyl-CoA synthetase
MSLLARIGTHAARRPAATALRWSTGELGYAALLAAVERALTRLAQMQATVIALDLENGPDWVVFDLAALALDLCIVPLPAFFSDAQLRHAITRSGAHAVISDRPDELRARLGDLLEDASQPLPSIEPGPCLLPVTHAARDGAATIPDGVQKVTFTSGTTGQPKGVPLRWADMRAVTTALADAVGVGSDDVHLALMPLPILLENIGGLYVSLWSGASVRLAAMTELGVRGAAGVDGVALAHALIAAGASTAIFTPQTLQSLVEAIEDGAAARPPLRFAAVGGAPVSPRLLQRAADAGLPVYEGYGLSECSSVVCLNTPQAHRPGSVGRPLPGVDLVVAADGEVVVRSCSFAGYLGDNNPVGSTWHTGDIGEFDGNGFLYLKGRRRNLFITAFGRNVAPEWVERELALEPAIAQAAVFGDARPFNVAVVTPAPGCTSRDVEAAIARVNSGLPDYARVGHWIAADSAFSPRNDMLTGTGRIRRDRVFAHYRDRIESIYFEAVS